MLNKEKDLSRWCGTTGFIIVDKTFEISDLDLIREMVSIIEMEEIFCNI